MTSNKNVLIVIMFIAVNGNWTTWSKWAICSVSCGGGEQSRTRSCSNPVPLHGGDECDGNTTESQSCNHQQCPGTYKQYM